VSVFGFAHRAFGHKICQSLGRDFPELKGEAFPMDPKAKYQAGMNAFLEQFVVDLSLLKENDDGQGTDDSCANG
jgi:hypothetical protein